MSLPNKQVLIVDNNEEESRTLASLLERAGHQPTNHHLERPGGSRTSEGAVIRLGSGQQLSPRSLCRGFLREAQSFASAALRDRHAGGPGPGRFVDEAERHD